MTSEVQGSREYRMLVRLSLLDSSLKRVLAKKRTDNYLFWAIAAKLAEYNNLYTHWNGKVDKTPNEGPI